MRFLTRLTIAGVIGLIAAVVFFSSSVRNMVSMSKPAVDLYETTDWSELKKGTHVKTNVDFVYDYFYYNYDEDSNKETSRAYMIPNLVQNADGIYIQEYIGVMVNAKDGFAPYDAAVNRSIAWWTDTTDQVAFPEPTIELDGYLRKMKNDEKDFLVEYIAGDWGMSEDEAEQYICPYMIMPYEKSDGIGGMIGAGALFLLGIVLSGAGVFVGFRRG